MKHWRPAAFLGILIVAGGLVVAVATCWVVPAVGHEAARPIAPPAFIAASSLPAPAADGDAPACLPSSACDWPPKELPTPPMCDGREPTLAPPEMLRLPPAGEVLTVQFEAEQGPPVVERMN